MTTMIGYPRFAVLICSMCLSALAFAQTVDSPDPSQVNYRIRIEERFDIANIRIDSQDADRSGSTTYTAPMGFTILGHSIVRRRHHSGVSHVGTEKPGRLIYGSSAMVSLREVLRRGFLVGTLSSTDEEISSGDVGRATASYLDFLTSFEARYHFVADTHASITFAWFADFKSFDHGAHLIAHAQITLQKSATEADAERATEIIRFALESVERTEVFELMDSALGLSRPSN